METEEKNDFEKLPSQSKIARTMSTETTRLQGIIESLESKLGCELPTVPDYEQFSLMDRLEFIDEFLSDHIEQNIVDVIGNKTTPNFHHNQSFVDKLNQINYFLTPQFLKLTDPNE
jgi:hypothetical protein